MKSIPPVEDYFVYLPRMLFIIEYLWILEQITCKIKGRFFIASIIFYHFIGTEAIWRRINNKLTVCLGLILTQPKSSPVWAQEGKYTTFLGPDGGTPSPIPYTMSHQVYSLPWQYLKQDFRQTTDRTGGYPSPWKGPWTRG